MKSLEEVGNSCNPLHHCELVFEGISRPVSENHYVLEPFSDVFPYLPGE